MLDHGRGLGVVVSEGSGFLELYLQLDQPLLNIAVGLVFLLGRSFAGRALGFRSPAD